MSEFTADVLFLPGRQGDWVDGGKHQNAFLHRWDPSTDYIRNLWNDSYSDIALCNASLKKLEDIRALNTLDSDVIDSYSGGPRNPCLLLHVAGRLLRKDSDRHLS